VSEYADIAFSIYWHMKHACILSRARALSLSLSASLSQDFWAAAKELPDGCYTQVKVGDKIANIFFFFLH
jgi:hypothetical protein